MDSDVFWPSGYFKEKGTHAIVSPNYKPNWRFLAEYSVRPFFIDNKLLNLVHKKTKQVAWAVSNCIDTPSKRMEVVKSLNQFIPVDIYGKCGDKSCPKTNSSYCRKMFERDYKFYLAFENSLCNDYVTEKVFLNMRYFIIPVVYGGADYTRFLPPRSYINVLDFNTTKELADHLWYLSNNPKEYMEYFWWKEYYYIMRFSFCDLCVKMHDSIILSKAQYYTDIDSWFKNGTCQSGIPIELSSA